MRWRTGASRVIVESFTTSSLRVVSTLVCNLRLCALSVIICWALNTDTVLVSVLLAVVHDWRLTCALWLVERWRFLKRWRAFLSVRSRATIVLSRRCRSLEVTIVLLRLIALLSKGLIHYLCLACLEQLAWAVKTIHESLFWTRFAIENKDLWKTTHAYLWTCCIRLTWACCCSVAM